MRDKEEYTCLRVQVEEGVWARRGLPPEQCGSLCLLSSCQHSREVESQGRVRVYQHLPHIHTRKDLYIQTEALTFHLHPPTIISQAHKLAINTSGHRQNLFVMHKDTISVPHHTPSEGLWPLILSRFYYLFIILLLSHYFKMRVSLEKASEAHFSLEWLTMKILV